MNQLSKRVSALEAAHNPAGQVICFWAIDDCEPMTEKQIDAAIAKAKAEGTPANARFWPVRWLALQEATP
jgi:hypothetical protein